jgi:hypothetical protein
MAVIAVRFFPTKGHRSTRNFAVVDGEILGKSRVGYNVNRAFTIHGVAAYLYASDKLAFLRA